ncbi:putative phiE125 gp8 family phage protein [Ochrobactrum daejeonense]|uniref:Putative phiE125 gp8 family phage protein n=1 Tax=Brucella daejeonensis TaxID=659015 RepID=A0A7W9B003_9HYPH|nr:phage head-tail connector protein [Brucella daejeonensis]MBB5703712.1 putative phiE125 gp8 family phage protein [Brucella daejeonensis]
MTMFLVTPPVLEPVTVADARAFLRISTDSEDDILRRLIAAAREIIESETGLSLIDQTWRLRVDRWPRSGRLALFKYPVKMVTTVVAYRPDGTAISFSPEEFILHHGRRPQRLYMAQYPDASEFVGLEVDFVAGFGESGVEVPDALKQAVLTLTAHLYESRAGVDAASAPRSFPPVIAQMIDSWRRVSL